MFRDKKSIVDELRRVVHPGGMVVIEFYHRPYHILRRVTGCHPVALDRFLYHYPRVREVRDLLGRDATIVPFRLSGERLLTKLVGDRRMRSLLTTAWTTPLRLAVDEYFVVVPGQAL